MHINMYGYREFAGISLTTIKIAFRNLSQNPSHAKKLTRKLAQVNLDAPMSILAEASKAEIRVSEGEIACLEGALMVIVSAHA